MATSKNTFSIELHPSNWTWDENKKFEMAIVEFSENTPNRWETIANSIPGKSAKQVEEHYNKLMDDVIDIESGLYKKISVSETTSNANQLTEVESSSSSGVRVKKNRKTSESVKYWTEDEHRYNDADKFFDFFSFSY